MWPGPISEKISYPKLGNQFHARYMIGFYVYVAMVNTLPHMVAKTQEVTYPEIGLLRSMTSGTGRQPKRGGGVN